MTRSLKRLRPIREHEGLSWEAFLEAVAEPPVRVQEPVPLAFETDPLPRPVPTAEDGARAPPPSEVRPETHHPHYR